MDTATALRLTALAGAAAMTVFGAVAQYRFERELKKAEQQFADGQAWLRDANAWADNVDDQLAAHRNARMNGQTPSVIVIETVRDN